MRDLEKVEWYLKDSVKMSRLGKVTMLSDLRVTFNVSWFSLLDIIILEAVGQDTYIVLPVLREMLEETKDD